MKRPLFLAAGIASVALGGLGILLPVLPTVPFLLLAAFCFARSNPAWERRLLDHPRWGPPIVEWRQRGAIGRSAKLAALTALVASAVLGLALLAFPWSWIPAAACAFVGLWIWTRPE